MNGTQNQNKPNPVKPHGCICPFHLLQVLSYVLFAIYAYTFYFIELISLASFGASCYTLAIPYTLLLIAIVIVTIVATVSDPTDPTVYEERHKREMSELIVSTEFLYYCQICKTHVLERTKHCGICNRCVDEFDHHCSWLNNCIGKRNYRYFIALLILVLALCIYQFGIDITVVVTFNSFSYDEQLAEFYGSSPNTMKIVGYVFVSVCILSQIMFVVLIVQLLVLHSWLKKQGLTTFEYILFLREKAEHPELRLDTNDIRKQHKSKVLTRLNNGPPPIPPARDQQNEEEKKGPQEDKLSIKVNAGASNNNGENSQHPESFFGKICQTQGRAKTVPNVPNNNSDLSPASSSQKPKSDAPKSFINHALLNRMGGCDAVQEISFPLREIDPPKAPLGQQKNPHKRASTPEVQEKKHMVVIERMNTSECAGISPENNVTGMRILIQNLRNEENKQSAKIEEESISWSAMLDNPNKAKNIIQGYNAYNQGGTAQDRSVKNVGTTSKGIKEIKPVQESRFSSHLKNEKNNNGGIVDIKDEESMEEVGEECIGSFSESRRSESVSNKAMALHMERISKI